MLVKQPNGKYCIFKPHDGGVKKINLTEEEYIALKVKEAKEELESASSFGELIKYEMVTEAQVKQMGSEKSLSELLKYIPRAPKDTHYVGCDFTTYGKCPSCGKTVEDSIGKTDKECSCGQILKWR